ncbi:uncharacterized protein PF3D7_1120000-like [Littorina saxatilis]|uniref:C1q domain-containing protein n=1 Tax=Littorina saxatilis TaxID=31220 RepID=A0AAN9GBL2_9CAEN
MWSRKSSKGKASRKNTSKSSEAKAPTEEASGDVPRENFHIQDLQQEVQTLRTEMEKWKLDTEREWKHELQMLKKEIQNLKQGQPAQLAEAITEESSVDEFQHRSKLRSDETKEKSGTAPTESEEAVGIKEDDLEMKYHLLEKIEELQNGMEIIQGELSTLKGDFVEFQQETKATLDDHMKRISKEARPSSSADGKSSKKVKKDDLEQLKNDVKALQTDTDKKMSSFEIHSKKVDEEIEAANRKSESENANLRKELEKLQKEDETFRTDVHASLDCLRDSMAEKTKSLESKLDTSSMLVSFHAQLTRSVETTEVTTLVCDGIVDNTSNSYDRTTGVFTAPVSGTYCFLATASPNTEKDEDDGDVPAALDIVINGKVKGGVWSYGHSWSSGHCVFRLDKDDEVWLRTLKGRHLFEEGWWTTFSGMLVQAQV